MENFQLTIVTPEKLLVKTEAIALGAIGSEGAFTALPGHMPFLTSLKIGLLWYRTEDNKEIQLAISGGFAEILPNKINILADSAEFIESIDIERAEEAKKRAEERVELAKHTLNNSDKFGDINLIRAERSLHKAINRISLANKHKQ